MEKIPSKDFALELAEHFRKKANHNKLESLASFSLIIGCSLCGPLFVTLGEGTFWGKAIPSILALISAGLTSWVQLRKPQLLWSLYRDSQRKIEDVLYKYIYNLEEFDNISEDARHKLLVNEVRKINIAAHSAWTTIAPTPESIGKL